MSLITTSGIGVILNGIRIELWLRLFFGES